MKAFLNSLAIAFVALLFTASCGTKTPDSGELVFDFNAATTGQEQLVPDSLQLYIDYTSVFDMKAKIKFYWEIMRPIIKNKTKVAYAIKGQEIGRRKCRGYTQKRH